MTIFLGQEKPSPSEVLAHHGVKGMHWGVRKTYESLRNKPTETIELKTADGKSVTLKESHVKALPAAIGVVNPRFRRTLQQSRHFAFHVDGKHVGDASFQEKSKDEINFVWVGVKPKQRGKGYASTVFDAGVAYSKQKNYKTISLEVPGNAPDARHIYEKRGFTPTGKIIGSPHDIWGGLTVMHYQIPQEAVAHGLFHADDEMETAFEQTFSVWGIDDFMFGPDLEHSDLIDEVLAHHGVKGMKWGVRKEVRGGSTKLGSNEAAPLIALGALYAGLVLAKSVSGAKDSGKFNQIRTKNTAWKKNSSLTKKMSIDDLYDNVVKPVNSNYGAKGTKMNCRRCTFSYEMRRRGYDVKATTSVYATGQDTKGLHKATSNTLTKDAQSIWGKTLISNAHFINNGTPESKAQDIFSALSKNPEGARGELGVSWHMGGGHSMAWEIVKGKPVIFDTQNSMTYRDSKAFTPFSSTVRDAAYTRLDNVKLDDSFLRKWVQNV